MQILSVLRYRLPGMPSSRTITSVLALAGFTVLAAGSSPELAEEIAEMSDELNEPTDEWDEWPEPVEVPPNGAPISADNFSLADLQGSQQKGRVFMSGGLSQNNLSFQVASPLRFPYQSH